MAVPIAELFISVGADIGGATAQLNALNAQLGRVGTNAQNATSGFNLGKIGSNLQTFGNNVQTVGNGLTAGLTAPLLAAGGTVFKVGSDFEHSFTAVKRTVDGLSPEGADALRESLLNMAKDASRSGGKTASELADIAALGGQLGLTGDELERFTSLTARLSVATDIPVAEIADDIGRAAAIFHLSGDDFERFGSSVTKLGNDVGGTERDIFEITRRLAGTLSTLGVKPDQILGISAALSEVGVQPEAGGTAISQLFLQMVNGLNSINGPSAEAKAKIQSLQDTITDLGGSLEVAELRQKEFGRNTPASVVKANQLAIDKYKRELDQANTKLTDVGGAASTTSLDLGKMADVAGVGRDEFANLVRTDPARAFSKFTSGLQALQQTGGPEAVTKALADLGITGAREVQTLLSLAAAQHDLDTRLDAANQGWTQAKALNQEVATALLDMQNQIKATAASLEVDLIRAYDKQRPALQGVVDDINQKGIPAFNALANAPTLSKDQLEGLIALAGLGPGLALTGGGLSAIGAALKIISALGGGGAGAGAGAGAAAGGTGAVATFGAIAVAGAAAVIAFDAVANHWDTTKAALEANPQTQPLANVIQFFKDHGDEFKSIVANFFQNALAEGNKFNVLLSAKVLEAGGIFSAFGTFIKGIVDNVIGPAFEQLKQNFLAGIFTKLADALAFLRGTAIANIPGVGGALDTAIADLRGRAAGATADAGAAQVTLTINNPTITSQALWDKFQQDVQNNIKAGLIAAQNAVSPFHPGTPLPGTITQPGNQFPGQPF